VYVQCFSITKIVQFKGNKVKCGTARQATEDNIVLRMSFACWIIKAKNTFSEYIIITDFP